MRIARLAALAALVALAPAPPLGARAIGSLEFLGVATLPSGSEFRETAVGGLSGIAFDPQLGRFYALTDDPSHRSPARFYTLEIDLAAGSLSADGVTIEDVTLLTDRGGRHFDRMVIDGEGIALTSARTLLISSEGYIQNGVPPSIREFRLDGREIRDLRVPKRWLRSRRGDRGARHNSAFEALTLHPDGATFFTATETALLQDGPTTDLDQPSPIRIARFRTSSGRHVADHLYLVGPVVDPPEPPDGLRVNGLVELLALGDDSLLALERSFSIGVGNSIRLYLVSTAGADNVRRTKSLEGRPGIRPVSKRLLIDLDDLGVELDNVEGMTFGPRLDDGRRTLILVSDDNFSPTQTTQFFAFAVTEGETPISAIQGAGHRSPLEGRWLADVRGVVTASDLEGRRRGFWLQDPTGDGNDATSEGLFVRIGQGVAPVAAGERVSVAGRIAEAGFPGALPVTRLEAHHVDVLQQGVALPEPIVLGAAGRPVPAAVDDDGLSEFDPRGDAIDLYESVEGMRVRIDAGRVVGPTSRFGVLTVAIDGGDGVRTGQDGLLLTENDPNTERLQVDGSLVGGTPEALVGRPLAGPLTGIIDYDFGNFRLVASEPIDVASGRWPSWRPQVTATEQLAIATYNVWNLSATDPDERFWNLGGHIASMEPHILALQEIQDDSGSTDDGVVSASKTLARLVEAIAGHGGPPYELAQLDPENNTDGGAPGGNIRVAFLYDPARVALVTEGSRLGERNPRRLFVDSAAFTADPERGFEGTRKPLAAEFEVDGRRIVAVNVHLKSKRGDDPLFGAQQPPGRPTEIQRGAQTRELGAWAAALLEQDSQALVVVLGDFNEHEFRQPMRLLGDFGLTNLTERIEQRGRYTYNYEGNSQAIDHILVSPALAARARGVEALHLNADLPDARRTSDHDAVLARFELDDSVE